MPTIKHTSSSVGDFEKSLNKLNKLIEQMEKGQLSLEAALQHFEEGLTLIQQCQKTLEQAEQKIQILTHSNHESE